MNTIFATLFGIILVLALTKKEAQKENEKWLKKVCGILGCDMGCIGNCGSDRCLERVYNLIYEDKLKAITKETP